MSIHQRLQAGMVLLCSLLFPISLQAASYSPIPFLAPGYTYDSTKTIDEAIRPLLAVSTNQGKNWSYAIKPNNLNNEGPPGYLNSANCQEGFCIAAGISSEKGMTPLIFTSTDQGVSWKRITLPLPSDYDPEVASVLSYTNPSTMTYCGEDYCSIAIHYYVEDPDHPGFSVRGKMFFVSTHDKGNTWTIKKSNQLGLLQSGQEHLKSFSCTDDNNCIATATAGVGRGYFSMIAVTEKDDVAFYKSNELFDDLKKYRSVITHAVKCQNETCIIPTLYENDHTGIIVGRHDKKAGWRWQWIPKPCPTKWCESFTFKAVSSSNLAYIGKSADNKNIWALSMGDGLDVILLRSEDDGNTWETIPLISHRNLQNRPAIDETYYAFPMSCTQDKCILLGRSVLNEKSLYIFTSHDKGKTWDKNDVGSLFPKRKDDFLDSIKLSHIQCHGTACTVMGSYVADPTASISYWDFQPLLLTNIDITKPLGWSISKDTALSPPYSLGGFAMIPAIIQNKNVR